MANRTYKIRKTTAGANKQQDVYRLTVPPDIARDLDPDLEYIPEVTDDGILYRPVEARPVEKKLPAWAKKSKR